MLRSRDHSVSTCIKPNKQYVVTSVGSNALQK